MARHLGRTLVVGIFFPIIVMAFVARWLSIPNIFYVDRSACCTGPEIDVRSGLFHLDTYGT